MKTPTHPTPESGEPREWTVELYREWKTLWNKSVQCNALTDKEAKRYDELAPLFEMIDNSAMMFEAHDAAARQVEELRAEIELLKISADTRCRDIDSLDNEIRQSRAQAERLAVALQEGIERTQSEYCSHKGECSPDLPTCYVKDMLATLQQYRDGGR
jgi:chromosome segregation ATPase